jgi:hypothetical protein
MMLPDESINVCGRHTVSTNGSCCSVTSGNTNRLKGARCRSSQPWRRSPDCKLPPPATLRSEDRPGLVCLKPRPSFEVVESHKSAAVAAAAEAYHAAWCDVYNIRITGVLKRRKRILSPSARSSRYGPLGTSSSSRKVQAICLTCRRLTRARSAQCRRSISIRRMNIGLTHRLSRHPG